MSELEPLLLDCGVHGQRIAAVVCRHMIGADRPCAGFIENSSDPNDLQAWCHACEARFEEEGGMTDTFLAFNNAGLVCVACYGAAKAHHTLADQ
ncbi:MAG: hypothetical protein HOQ32_12015 [Lysobacter sp.]|nr:hypothetical protein [Lysobacter sp.]